MSASEQTHQRQIWPKEPSRLPGDLVKHPGKCTTTDTNCHEAYMNEKYIECEMRSTLNVSIQEWIIAALRDSKSSFILCKKRNDHDANGSRGNRTSSRWENLSYTWGSKISKDVR